MLTGLNCGGGGGGGGGGGTTPASVDINGTLLDSRNNPIPFATITITSTPVTTTTNTQGAFNATVDEGNHTIVGVKNNVSFLDTTFTAASGNPNLGSLLPTKLAGYYPWYHDADTDMYGDAYDVVDSLNSLGPAYTLDYTDCDDNSASVNPGASEVCNGTDDNCNGSSDEGLPIDTYYQDSDSDTYGNLGVTQDSCIQPPGYVLDSTDCNDAAASINPGATELCDGVDNDCSGTIDEGFVLSTFYVDSDGDTYGNAAVASSACSAPAGYVSDNTDCNDNLASVHPNATEICNGQDEDCDLEADNGLTTSTYYRDFDTDGYGNPLITQLLCGPISGYVADSTDCNDGNGTIYPGALEVCDGYDNDCDTFTDEDPPTLYADVDVDGFGTSGTTILACTAAGYVPFSGDCDDSDAAVNPLVVDICGDTIDQDCSGADLSCPSYPMVASTIAPLQQGDYWSYSVNGDDTGTFTKTITASNIVSPETSENCTVVSLSTNLDTYGSFLSYDYYGQDIDGTIRICGYDEGGGSDWVAAKDGGSYTFYASPLSVGQTGSETFSFDTPSAEGAYSYTVDSIQSVQTPAGLFSTYKIFQTYYEFWPGATISQDEKYFEFNVSWLSPGIGEVQYESQMLDFIGTGSTPTSTFYTLNSLTGASYFGTSSCGPTGPGSGQLSQLSGTWAGTGNDHFISAGVNWTDYEVSVTMDGSGNITSIILNGTDSGFTGIATAVDDSLYTIEFNDASTGQLFVDSTFNYMVFIKNYSFISGDMSFSVLQKGASGKRAGGYDKNLAVGLFAGFGYDYCASSSSFYRFSPASLNVMAESSGSLGMPVKGIGPNGFFNGNILLWQNIYGWWNGFESGGGDLHLFLSPDGLFAGAYHQVRPGFYIWPSEFAFYALKRF